MTLNDATTPSAAASQGARRKTAKDFSPALLEIYDGYVHGRLTKREFLDRATLLVGAGAAAGVLAALQPNYALANEVSPDDPAIVTKRIKYASPEGHGEIEGLLAMPSALGRPRGGVLVVHENRGLNPYIEDVARRVAKAGYVALAPDGLSPLGGYPGTDDEGREMQRSMDGEKLMNDFFAGFEHLSDMDETTAKIGAVGFCYGGGVCNALAVAFPEMACSVPFYGRQAAAEDVPGIGAALLIHYAENDERINAGWPAYEAALKAAGKAYEAHFYPGVNHGFHNDTTPRYDKAAATLAWERTLDWFEKYLA
ncbi:MAG: dienelactone hydrolase family protein [Alphaproteobacteria bacterium]|nr:dienelactone hydrolase family protein [Alphaproteobacteria bacterium]